MSRNDNGGETIDSRGDTLIIPKFLLVPFLLPLATDDRRLIFSFFFFLLLAEFFELLRSIASCSVFFRWKKIED